MDVSFDQLIKKNNIIWDKIRAYLKKVFDSEPVYNNKFLKPKIKSHGDKVTDLYDKEIPKVDSNHTCIALISLDTALKEDYTYKSTSGFKRM